MELNHRRLHVGQVSSSLDHGIVLTVTEVGIEPADPSFKATDFYQQKLPRIVKSALRESNPPFQLGRMKSEGRKMNCNRERLRYSSFIILPSSFQKAPSRI